MYCFVFLRIKWWRYLYLTVVNAQKGHLNLCLYFPISTMVYCSRGNSSTQPHKQKTGWYSSDFKPSLKSRSMLTKYTTSQNKHKFHLTKLSLYIYYQNKKNLCMRTTQWFMKTKYKRSNLLSVWRWVLSAFYWK